MELSKNFDMKEINSLLAASLILGFVVSFRKWGYEEFSLAIGISNLFRTFLVSFIVLSIYLIANKNAARLHGSKITFRVWNMERYWFSRSSKFSNLKFFGTRVFKSFKAGFFIPVLFSLFSNGLIKFAAVGYSEINEISSQRMGRRLKNLTDFEIARIHLAGPMAVLLLAIFLSSISSFNSIVEIAKLVAIYSFLPFSRLDGSKILFGSLPLYLFALIFTVGSLILVTMISGTATIFLALLTAIILMLIYLYKTY